jgi:SMC interacting uncharacterized protein involved in chromosome segregation
MADLIVLMITDDVVVTAQNESLESQLKVMRDDSEDQVLRLSEMREQTHAAHSALSHLKAKCESQANEIKRLQSQLAVNKTLQLTEKDIRRGVHLSNARPRSKSRSERCDADAAQTYEYGTPWCIVAFCRSNGIS